MSNSSEILKIIKSTKTKGFIILMCLLPMLDLFYSVYNIYSDYWFNKEYYPNGLGSGNIPHPAFGSFLSASTSGHIFQMLLIWLIPVYLMIIYSDSYIQETKCGYNNIILSKMGKKDVLKKRLQISFLIPFGISLISLFLNFIIANIVFASGTYKNSLDSIEGMGKYFEWMLKNPNFTYIIYIFSYCFIVGMYGVFCTALCFVIRNRKIVYAITIFLWLIQIIYPYSVTYAMQPFTEYGIKYFFVALTVVFVLMIIAIIMDFKLWVCKDEI